MPQINTLQPLGAEGAIKFKLTPIKNGTNRLYLIDVGLEARKNRITLLITKDASGSRSLALELFNSAGVFLTESKAFPAFQLGTAFNVELEWSSGKHTVAVYIGDSDDEFLKIENKDVVFEGLGSVVHSGEDIGGDNKTEIIASS